jgi:hypothetical protein
MKTFLRNISAILIVSGVLIASCKKDFLNTKSVNLAPAETTWADPNLSTAYVTELYNGLSTGLLDQMNNDCLTDNALYNFGKQDMMEGNISPDHLGTVQDRYEWGAMYTRIRSANIALENLAKAPLDSALVNRLKGETYFMRAYFYNQLLRYYGGIPLVKSSYSINSSDFTIARSSYSDCVTFILTDLDQAASLLSNKSMDKGRATTDAAKALKVRVLTYAASTLHSKGPINKLITAIPTGSTQFKNPELLAYTDDDTVGRWQKVYNTAAPVVNSGKYGYMLNLSAPATAADGFTNYQNSYLSRNGGEAEIIFARYFSNAKDEWGAWYGRNNCTNGYHGWTSSEPTQNLVDDYEALDGTTGAAHDFSWSNPADAATPYAHRDPRFYASIMYDGSPWKPRTADGAGIDPYNELQFGTYQTGSAASPAAYFGLDTRNGPIENWNGTRTGYAIRKFMDPNPAIVDQNTRSEVPSPQIRFTEVVFNYIEACLHLSKEAEATTWLNRIRFRSGMPAVAETGPALVKRYRRERNKEMLFEEQRFFDARRWMIAPTTLGNKVKIMKITGTLKAGKTVPIYRYNTDNYNYSYTVQEIDPGVENRAWADKVYFPPISRDEMNKNGKLIQNPGY